MTGCSTGWSVGCGGGSGWRRELSCAMSDYCTLLVFSDLHNELPVDFLNVGHTAEIRFTDNESPERIASFQRLRKKGVNRNSHSPRYRWSFSSDGVIDSADVHEHLVWVLAQLKPRTVLSEMKDAGYASWLQFYWESNGTGAGPLITPALAGLLARQGVELRFGFYLA